ncbi:hypothetical protein bcgnr5376_55910 [Bacillus cereus]
MIERIQDGLFFWACSVYLPAIFCAFGINVHWVAIAFCFVAAINLSKKLGGFLKKKIVAAVVKELQNDNNFKG